MLSKSRLSIRVLLLILVATGTWISLTNTFAIEHREYQRPTVQANRADGLAAWQKVYSVLISPRCINCHTATNYPQQGDDRRRHFANVIRGGPEGKGVPALNCLSCHQQANADSTGVPGSDSTMLQASWSRRRSPSIGAGRRRMPRSSWSRRRTRHREAWSRCAARDSRPVGGSPSGSPAIGCRRRSPIPPGASAHGCASRWPPRNRSARP